MRRDLEDFLRTAEEGGSELWHKLRARAVADGENAYRRGRQAYDDAIRQGQAIVARTPQEIRSLGARVVPPSTPVRPATNLPPPISRRPPPPSVGPTPPIDKGLGRQGRAAASGFADEFTFGLADPVLSAGDALHDGGFAGFGNRYQANMAAKRAEDAYDEAHYGLARNTGRVAGLAADVAIMGLPAAERALVRALPQGARIASGLAKSRYALDPRGLAAMATVGGAASGLTGQYVGDIVRGRPGTLGDYAGAAVGGAADGLTTLALGPSAGGATGGVVTTAAQSYLNSQPITTKELLDSAQTSALLGRLAGTAGAYGAARLSPNMKGALGEAVSDVKTFARDGEPAFGQQTNFNLEGGGFTRTDNRFLPTSPGKAIGITESKVGPTARLYPRQLQAQAQADIDYVVDGWRFNDFGKMAGAAASPYGAQVADRLGAPWAPTY